MKRLLFLGDSLVEYGDWATLLPDWAVQNRGIAGETLSGLACRLDAELESSPGFEVLVLQSGTNDLWNRDPCFPAIYTGFLPRLRVLVECPLVLCSLAPSGIAPQETIHAINAELARMAASVADCTFLDLESPLATAQEAVFLADGVHFSAHGYQLWAAALRSCLRSLFP